MNDVNDTQKLLAEAEEQIISLGEAINQILGWINAWSPNFTEDEEWQTITMPQVIKSLDDSAEWLAKAPVIEKPNAQEKAE